MASQTGSKEGDGRAAALCPYTFTAMGCTRLVSLQAKIFLETKAIISYHLFLVAFRLPDPYGVIMQDTMSKIFTLSHSIDNASEDKTDDCFPSLHDAPASCIQVLLGHW